MKKAWRNGWRKPGLRILCAGLTVGAFTGCKVVPPLLPAAVQDLGPSYKPTNIYRSTDSLPLEVRRVAVLPLTTTSSTAYLDAGVETLEPLLYSELEKSKRFEVIPVTQAQMKQWTGRIGWRADEQLPPDMLKRVSEMTGSDAVLFSQLTRYEPYQPLAVGWKFTLVETHPAALMSATELKARILWSADEVLDAGDPTVTTGARTYYTQHLRNDAPSADASTMLSSPARFGQYTLATLLGTLPGRAGENIKR